MICPGMRPDISAAMPPDLGFVVHAAHRDPGEFAAQRPRDRTAQRGLAHSRRPDETQNRTLQNGPKLQHREVIQNAVFHLFQVVVILVQNLGGPLDIHLLPEETCSRAARPSIRGKYE